MTCKFCLQDKKLGKSHVIPEGFFRAMKGDENTLLLLSNTPGHYPKKAPIGIYDNTILCLDCEKLFGVWDDYAQSVLLKKFDASSFTVVPSGKLLEIASFDYVKLKLFFLSLLWRASVSTHPVFRRIDLGPREQYLRTLLASSNPSTPDDFSVSLAKFEGRIALAVPDPHTTRFSGVRFALFTLGGFVAHIKVDSQPTPSFLAQAVMKPDAPLWVVIRDFMKSKEAKVMQNIVRTSDRLMAAKSQLKR